MWCNRGAEEVRWGCPARGHGAVATQTRGCSQCLYQRLPKSCGNIRVNAAGRAVTIRRRRVSRSRRCSYARNRGILRKRLRAACISPRVRERKEGPGTAWGRLPPRRRFDVILLGNVRSDLQKEEREEDERSETRENRREKERERAPKKEEVEKQERTPKSPFYSRSPPRDVPADTADSRGARGGEKSGKARGWRERG